MADRDLEVWKLAFSGVQTVGIVGGAIWAAWRFKRERVHADLPLSFSSMRS
jgi:hypothetical protein